MSTSFFEIDQRAVDMSKAVPRLTQNSGSFSPVFKSMLSMNESRPIPPYLMG